MMLLTMMLALLIGAVTVLSSFMLPLLPFLFQSNTISEKKAAGGVLAGWLSSFLLLSLALALFVQSFDVSDNVLHYTAVLILGFLGFILILPTYCLLFSRFVALFAKWNHSSKPEGVLGRAILFGLALGAAWAPFAGLVLSALAAFIATNNLLNTLIWLAFAYSLGSGLSLFWLIYKRGDLAGVLPDFITYAEKTRQILGFGLLLTAIVFAYSRNPFVEKKVGEDLPAVQIEDQAWVESQLRRFSSPQPRFPNQDNDPFSRTINTTPIGITPDIYLGYNHSTVFEQTQIIPDLTVAYNDFGHVNLNQVGLNGKWEAKATSLLSQSNNASLTVNFRADQVYLLLGGRSDVPVRLKLDGKPIDPHYYTADMNEKGEILVDKGRLYHLIDLKGENGRHELTITVPQGVRAYALTFSDKSHEK